MGGGFFGGRDWDCDRFRGFGCGGGCGGGCGFGGWDGGCGCGFRDRVKTKFFNVRGCVAERCGGGRDWGWDC